MLTPSPSQTAATAAVRGRLPRRAARALLRTLRNTGFGVRLSLFLPVRRPPVQFSLDDAVGQLAACLSLAVLLGYLKVAPERVFNPYGITYVLAVLLLLAVGCYGVSRTSRGRVSVLPLTATVFSCATAAVMLDYGLGELSKLGLHDSESATGTVLIGIAILAWLIIVAGRAIGWAGQISRARLVLSSLLLAAIPAGTLTFITPTPLWYSWNRDQSSPRVDIEGTYYRQWRLVSESLSALAAGRPGTTDLYFVGFAGYASEDVFMNEAQAAADLFDRRFDTANRSVLLVNNPKTVHSKPLATVSNLRWVLSSVAKTMNRDEDVLFLFLTSHGYPGTLSAYSPRLGLNDLTATMLRKLLDASQIKWRVLVVSACYSGSFIKHLQDDRTLVITASAADRTSFGCGHDGTFTYFGEALFGKALQAERSFERAFRIAEASIENREKAEGLEPSRPQLFIGKDIAAKLHDIERRLQAND